MTRNSPIYISLRTVKRKFNLPLVYQAQKRSGRWGKLRSLPRNKVNKLGQVAYSHYKLDANRLRVRIQTPVRLGFIINRPKEFTSLLPELIIILEHDKFMLPAVNLGSGDHGKLNCEQLAADIEWHENRASELDDIKNICDNPPGPQLPSPNPDPPTVSSQDGGGDDEPYNICADIDSFIFLNNLDLEDAKKEFDKNCRNVS